MFYLAIAYMCFGYTLGSSITMLLWLRDIKKRGKQDVQRI